eukprot:s1611_g2.t1
MAQLPQLHSCCGFRGFTGCRVSKLENDEGIPLQDGLLPQLLVPAIDKTRPYISPRYLESPNLQEALGDAFFDRGRSTSLPVRNYDRSSLLRPPRGSGSGPGLAATSGASSSSESQRGMDQEEVPTGAGGAPPKWRCAWWIRSKKPWRKSTQELRTFGAGCHMLQARASWDKERIRLQRMNSKAPEDRDWPGRFNPGQRAYIEIRHYSHTTNMLISRSGFQRLARDMCQQVSQEKYDEWKTGQVKYIDGWEPPQMYRMEVQGLACLQEACEGLLVAMMEEMNHAAIHAKRVTIMPKDMALVSRLSGTNAYQNYGLQKPQVAPGDAVASRGEVEPVEPAPKKRPAAEVEGKRKRKKKDG